MSHLTVLDGGLPAGPWAALGGGALIGISVAILLLANGKVAGISGILGGLVDARSAGRAWRALFVAGLLSGGIVAHVFFPQALGPMKASVPTLAAAGLLVGVGTRLAGGCTSGHGVCGNSRLSVRSIVATLTFMAVAGAIVFLFRHVVAS
jgi:uncharacterized membrane protein YedE/YeeE